MAGCNADVIEGICPLEFLNNFDLCDLNQYKHPPFMWTLWYISLVGKVIYDKIQELINGEGGSSEEGGGGGGGGGGGAAAPADEPPPPPPPPAEEAADEAPPEEGEED